MPYIVPDAVREPLYAVVPYFNPWRWKSREKHTIRAIKHFMDSGATVILVEASFNRREFSFENCDFDQMPAVCEQHSSIKPLLNTSRMTDRPRHQYIQVRTKSELWLKENLINVAVANLPFDWQNVCWLDSDVMFLRPNWVGECIHKLQHYKFLQMFSHARDLGPNYEMLPEEYPHANGVSFINSWMQGTLAEDLSKGGKRKTNPTILADLKKVRSDIVQLEKDFAKLVEDEYYYGYGARRIFPGLAWACTREAWDEVGGLLDCAIWGGGDWHMAHALVDKTDSMMHTGLSANYKQIVSQWHTLAQKHIRQNVGVMEGSIVHMWHGKKTVRGYGDKHRILARLGFDPIKHLKRDFQGVYQLQDDGSKEFIQLRDSMRKIAKERNEDGNET